MPAWPRHASRACLLALRIGDSRLRLTPRSGAPRYHAGETSRRRHSVLWAAALWSCRKRTIRHAANRRNGRFRLPAPAARAQAGARRRRFSQRGAPLRPDERSHVGRAAPRLEGRTRHRRRSPQGPASGRRACRCRRAAVCAPRRRRRHRRHRLPGGRGGRRGHARDGRRHQCRHARGRARAGRRARAR